MRTIITAALCLTLNGCFFFYIPGSAIQSASDSANGYVGRHCVGEQIHVGDRIQVPQGSGTVAKLEGPSGRCTEPARPVRALVNLE